MEVDVAVIGGSSAGFYAAELLAAQGKRVAVFERRNTLSHSRRTLIVTSELQRVTGPIPMGARLGETRMIRLACGESAVEVSLSEADPIVERSAFVRWMHDRAVTAGAEVFWSAGLTEVSLEAGSACIQLAGRTGCRKVRVRDAIIGADGVRSRLALSVGISRPESVNVFQAEVLLPGHWDPCVTQVWFDTNDASFFYWLIPESRGRAVAGVIGEGKNELPMLLRRFLVRHGLSPLAYQGARVAVYHPGSTPWAEVGATKVYLVGDAAGQVKVTTVGGTVTGLLGAEAAARSVLRGSSYRRELRSLNRELNLHWMIRRMLNRLDNAGYELLLASLSEQVRGFLARYNRDSMASVFWRLPLLSPPLLLVAWRAMSPAPGITRIIRAIRRNIGLKTKGGKRWQEMPLYCQASLGCCSFCRQQPIHRNNACPCRLGR